MVLVAVVTKEKTSDGLNGYVLQFTARVRRCNNVLLSATAHDKYDIVQACYSRTVQFMRVPLKLVLLRIVTVLASVGVALFAAVCKSTTGMRLPNRRVHACPDAADS